MRLRPRFFLLSFFLSILVTIGVGALLTWQMSELSLGTISLNVSQQIRHLDFALKNFFKDAENDLLGLLAHEELRTDKDSAFTNFLNADEKSFRYRIGVEEARIIEILNGYRLNHPHVNSVYMGRANGSFVRSHPRERPTAYDPRSRPWYTLALERPWETRMTAPYMSVTSADINIGVVRAMRGEDGVVYGVLGMDVTLNNLTDYIGSFSIYPAGSILLVDPEGLILASHERDIVFTRLSTLSPSLVPLLSEEHDRPLRLSYKSLAHYAFSRSLGVGGWRVIVLMPRSNVLAQIIRPVALSLTCLVIVLILLSIVSYAALTALIVRPLRTFITETSYIGKTTRLDRRIDILSRDEIGELAQAYNAMVESLSTSQYRLKLTEENLVRHRDQLESIVEERTSSLQELNARLAQEKDRAQAADRLKSAFLATMSHELRTPLNSIIGFTGIILKGLVGPLSDEQSKQLSMVMASARHLLALINDVLDISKIEAGQMKMTRENYELLDVLHRAVLVSKPMADKKGLALGLECPEASIPMRGDSRRVEQVMLNLLSNALKFTEKGEITVYCKMEGGHCLIEVRDSGIGIKEEDLGSLFQAFIQIDSGLSRRYEGTGLGLSISKRLVEMMGGKMWVKSEWGKGSSFYFSLPDAGSAR